MKRELGCVHALPLILVIGLLAGCSNVSSVTGKDEKTGSTTQAETAATTSTSDGKNLVVVAFIDETDSGSYVQYNIADRIVLAGTSLMGWAYSGDQGSSWTYGGKVPTTPDWPILWGDPALTTSGAHSNIVFMSNLAVPIAKYNAAGGGGIVGKIPSGPSPLGGACIARSSDGGRTFALQQCVSNTDPVADTDLTDAAQGHFYDGGNLASNAQGEVFAAFIDVYTRLVDVWYSPTDGDSPSFTRLLNPFPDMIAVAHPVLRVGTDGSLYVAVLVKVDGIIGEQTPYVVYINRYLNGAWGTPRQATHSTFSGHEGQIDFQMDLTVDGKSAPLQLRVARQYSFDVGAASPGGDDAIRFLYTRQDPNTQLFYVDASVCGLELSTDCKLLFPPAMIGKYTEDGWTLGPSTPQDPTANFFSPNVVAFTGPGAEPTWQATILYTLKDRPTVFMARMTLGYANDLPFTIPVDIVKDAPVCPDLRGWWGDYDAFLWVGLQGNSRVFIRFITDSSPGCTRRWGLTAAPQHVGSVRYAY